MADLSITASEVIPGTGAKLGIGEAGEALTPAQPVYRKTDGKVYKADADALASAASIGLTTCTAASGQDVIYQWAGPLTIGASASVAQGQVYCVSATAGGISPEGDIASGKYVTVLGVGNSTNGIEVCLFASGVAHA